MQANSQVKVSITASLGQGFQQVFTTADKRMEQLGKTASEMSKKVGNVEAFAKQKRATIEAKKAWEEATAKVAALKREMEASGQASRKQEAELNRAVAAAKRASGAYNEQNTKLNDLRRTLEQSGVSVKKLNSEYKRLQDELAKTKSKHDRLEDSLKRQNKLVQAMVSGWQKMQTMTAGVIAAGAVLSRPVGQAMTYDQQLTYMADTAGAGRSVADKRAMKEQLAKAVNEAVTKGGGKREDAASALQTLIASGKFEGGEASGLLPSIVKTAFASGGNADDMAKTAIALKQFGIRDVGGEFDKMMRAGQLGNFELKDMARYLPQQLALAKAAGFSGSQGLTDLLAFNQVAMTTAGTQDEAGNNVVNLLQKFSSREFADSIGKNVKVKKGDPTKDGAFDWSAYAMKRRGEGVNTLEAFAEILDRQMAGDKKYQGLQTKLKTATGDERTATLQAMSSIAEGSQVGQIIADRQALMAALAARYGKDQMKELKTGIAGSSGAVDQSSAFIRGETWAKAMDTQNAVSAANENSYNSIKGPMGAALDAINGVATEFPKLTTAAYSAAVALTALAAAGIAGRFVGGGGAGAAGSAATIAGGAAKAAKWGKFLGPAAVVGAGALDAYAVSQDATKTEAQKKAGYMGAAGGTGGALAGMYTGAAIGSWLGPLGTVIGGGVGALAGGWLGNKGGTAAGNAIFGESSQTVVDAAKTAADAAKTSANRPNVTVQGSTYNLTVQAPPGAGAAELGAQMERMLREAERKREADMRSQLSDKPGY